MANFSAKPLSITDVILEPISKLLTAADNAIQVE
jgi:hypothetical protein